MNTPPKAESVVVKPALNIVATIIVTRLALKIRPSKACADPFGRAKYVQNDMQGHTQRDRYLEGGKQCGHESGDHDGRRRQACVPDGLDAGHIDHAKADGDQQPR